MSFSVFSNFLLLYISKSSGKIINGKNRERKKKKKWASLHPALFRNWMSIDFPITKYQPVYYVVESFEDMIRQLKEFALTLDRPFDVSFDESNESIHVYPKRNVKKWPQGTDSSLFFPFVLREYLHPLLVTFVWYSNRKRSNVLFFFAICLTTLYVCAILSPSLPNLAFYVNQSSCKMPLLFVLGWIFSKFTLCLSFLFSHLLHCLSLLSYLSHQILVMNFSHIQKKRGGGEDFAYR